jgi:CheY-like chemotaxis protein
MAKVLLVEDDNNLREIFEMRLKAEGYDTAIAGDGEEGIVVAMKQKPDLIVADVMMPKLSGFEMVETLKAAPEMAQVKIVMMTALGQAEDQARGEKLGVVKYLVKSQVTLEDFIRVIREILPPGQAAADFPKESTAAQPAEEESSNNNKQESEQKMPEDPQATNPAPLTPTPPADDSAPADANPIGAPVSANDFGGAQPAAQEQSDVQGQINNFAASAPATPAEPVVPEAPADEPVPAADIPVSAPPVDPVTPPAEPAAPETPAETPPSDQPTAL